MKAFTQDPEQMEELVEFLDEDLENIRRVVNYVKSNSLDVDFEVHAKAETVEESCQHSTISASRIVKSLLFIADEPILVLCSGDKRVDTKKLEEIRETEVRMADPEEVEEHTGYIIGGVSPFDTGLKVYMEKSITEHDYVRPAAGSRIVGLRIDPQDLKDTTDAEVRELAE